MKKKTLLLITGILVLAGVAAFVLISTRNNGVQFRTEKIAKGEIVSSVTATGTVNAVVTVLVGTQVSGTIERLYVDFNSQVKAGQLIAQIDPATFKAQVDQAKANLLAAKANLQKAEAALVDAKRTLDRNTQLFSKGLIARSDLDTADTAHETNKALVSAGKAQVVQSQAALDFAVTNLRYTKIVSPVDGTVVSRNVDVGQTVAASFQTPTLFTIAQDLTKMQIDTNVPEADVGRIKVGQDVEFNVDAYPDTLFKGTVSQVRIAPITVQNVVTYDVVILVRNEDLKLRPGMTANVSIIIAKKDGVLKIPNAALRFKLSDKQSSAPSQASAPSSQKGPGIWILENGKPVRVKMSLGISDGNYTEIASGDLREGQEVVVERVTKGQKAGTPTGPRMF